MVVPFVSPISEPELQALASRRARGDADLADELAQDVRVKLFRGKFDPARGGRALAWADRVMTNYLHDLFRRRVRLAAAGLATDAADPRDGQAESESRDALAAPFSPADSAAIRRWPPADRVLLLCRGRLWQKVPAELRLETTAELGLPAEFPGPGFDDATEPERRAVLRRGLRVSASGLSHRWKRGQRRLRELQFVRALVR